MSDETQEVEDARETRDLVLAAILPLAGRAIEHVDGHDMVDFVALADSIEGAGYVWELRASTGRGYSFVRITAAATPAKDTPPTVDVATMARIMGNSQAGFDTQVPRAWVEAAIRGGGL